jgi:RNA polymerase sigma-70 factor (ECF subfamily)
MVSACSWPTLHWAVSGQMVETPEVSSETEELRPVVRAVVAHLLGQSRQHPDVEDCTHEALRRALEGRHRLRSGEPLRPWVIGIARHVALDALRARKKNRRLVSVDADGETDALEQVADSGPGADEKLDRAQRIHRVREAMGRLAPDQRRALELFHLEGLGYREIADKMGVPIGTVGTWVTRGRKTVAAALEGADA